MTLCFDLMGMIGDEVKIIRETNKNKIKFNSMINAYNKHNEELRESITHFDENHLITYIQYYRKIDSENFISSVNHSWVKRFDKMLN